MTANLKHSQKEEVRTSLGGVNRSKCFHC